jgi:hypothetical protein
MATNVVPTDVVSVRAWSTLGNQAAVNTYNFECISQSGSGATDQDVANGFDGFMSTFYTTILANQSRYNGVQVYFLRRTGPLPSPAQSTAGAGPGVGGVDAMPRNTCAILKYRSFSRGPGGRGRVFLGMLPTDTMDANGHPTTGFNTFVNAFAANLLLNTIIGTPPNTITLAWVLARRAVPVTVEQIIFAESANKFGQMHKRGDYGRPNASPI